MRSPTGSRARAHAVLTLVVALAVGACNQPGATITPTPIGSGIAACPAVPAPPDDLEGWEPLAQAPTIVPYLINTAGTLVCGSNRVLFTMIDESSRPVGAPDRAVEVAFFNLGRDPSTPIATIDGSFVWAIEGERGIYVANVTFPEAGRYGAEFTTAAGGGPPETIRLTFDVQPGSAVVKAGDRAPASKTPTLADVGGDPRQISTDPEPEPAFYETSVDQAIAGHEPFAVIFATPKFCKTAQCGPTLERIKPFVKRYPSVTFINIEPYRLKLVDGTLEADTDAAGELQTTPVSDEWRLINEPIVFVVDRDGFVRGAFELIFSDAELTAALDEVK